MSAILPYRIGNQTTRHCDWRIPYHFALRHGFDAFEWFVDKGPAGWCEDDMGPAQRREVRQHAADQHIRFSVHAPHMADAATAQGSRQIAKSIGFAGDVAAGLVNIHLFPENAPERFADALAPLLQTARECDVTLALENTPQTTPAYCNAVFDALTRITEAHGRVGMCLDSGHANLCPLTRNDYVRYVDLLGAHVPIVHWHAHENWGDADTHLTLFTGPAGGDCRGQQVLAARLSKRGFCGSIVLEQWPDPPEQLVEARNRLRTLLRQVPQA